MKVSVGFILLIVGILGVARGGSDAPPQALSQMAGNFGIASFTTLVAAFLLVGGLLILARTGSFSFEGSRGHVPAPGDTGPRAANKNS